DISTPTTAYPLYGPTLHWPIEIPAHHYEQYAGPPPPTTDPYAYRLAAPSMANHSNLVTCLTGLPVGRRDGTNTPTAPPFETSRTRVVGSQGRRGDLPKTNPLGFTETFVTIVRCQSPVPTMSQYILSCEES
ncbi:hypothetical protein MferCBS49748_002230, partial [Microsporum ferrugineum]